MRPSRVLLVVLVLLLALGALWPRRGESPRPALAPATDAARSGDPMGAAVTAAGAPATTNGETARDTATAPPPQRDEVGAGGIFGIVLDHAGQPLAGIQVRLLRIGAPEHERRLAIADGAGRFAFDDARGAFTVSIWNALPVSRDVTLAAGERRFVELRVDEPCVLLTGIVRRGGEVVAGRDVFVRGVDRLGDVEHKDITDERGVFRHLLRPGSYSLWTSRPRTAELLRLHGTDLVVDAPGPRRVVDEVTLTGQQARVRRDIELSAPGLRVLTVAATDGSPVHQAIVQLQRPTVREQPRRRVTDPQGVAEFDELEVGGWHVSVTSDWHMPVEGQEIEVRANELVGELRVALQPAGQVQVRIDDRDGNRLSHLDPSRLRLQLANGTALQGETQVGKQMELLVLTFLHVPPGRHELHGDDRRDATGRVEFAPCEPIAAQVIEVRAGERTDVRLVARPRPMLGVRATSDLGDAIWVTLSVTGPFGIVAPRSDEAAAAGNWSSPVPPGDYTISIAAPDAALRTERIVVLGEDVERLIRVD
ncbi:MAG: hypothetical protein JNM25_15960 [Planctomycetes bacterium]|nr:hypothetical protein [Planctomycetota bacterium]